jgi:F0F1-type ATP synthase gamma subunit
MAKITEKTTDLEQHIIEVTEQYKKMISALTGNNNIELYIQVRGVPIETLVQTSKEIKTAENCGIENNLTNHYVNLDFDNVHLSLNTLNEL